MRKYTSHDFCSWIVYSNSYRYFQKIAQRNLSPELCDANNNSHNYSKKINNEACYSIQSCYISVHRELYWEWKSYLPKFSHWMVMKKISIFWSSGMWIIVIYEKSLILGKTEGRKKRGHQRIRWLDDITDAKDMNLGKLQEMVKDREGWHVAIHGVANSWI